MPGIPTKFYLRLVFVLIGAAFALSLALLDVALIALMVSTPLPIWVVVWVGTVLVVAPIVSLGLVPAMRTIEGVAVQTLLVVDLPGGAPGPPRTWPQRRRTLGWFAVHLMSGAVLVAAVKGTIAVGNAWTAVPLVVVLVAVAVGLGEMLARLAPLILGPAAAEGVAMLQQDVDLTVARNRIAREIHDSVGRALSIVTVQAGAARQVIGHDPEAAEIALKAIETAARDAAADLDHVLGLLREDAAPPETAPASDLDSLEQLVDATREAGLAVDHDIHGDISTVPTFVSREAYRIVQEALTNALKYSTEGIARLVVTRSTTMLTVTLVNRSSDQFSGKPAGSGQGLPGMTERVQAMGGSITSASVAPDAWMLSATLPLPESRS